MMHKLFESWRNFIEEDQLDEASILKNKYPFKALFLLGPAGAGKSFISKNIGIPGDFKVSNPDERIEAVFPVFGISLKFADADIDPEQASLEILQQASRKILQNANIGHTTNLLSIAQPLVFDTTGEDVEKMSNKIKNLVSLGYDVGVIIVNVPPEVSVARDQSRKRTVGARRTGAISAEFQQRVVIGQAYPKIAQQTPFVDVFGEVYPNIFDLRTGQLLPGVEPELLQKYEQFKDATPERAKQILTGIKSDLVHWLTELENPKGKIILQAMRELVKASGGKLGQNMNDIPIAMANPQFADMESLRKAVKLLSNLSGNVSGVTGKKKKTGGIGTIRGATTDD